MLKRKDEATLVFLREIKCLFNMKMPLLHVLHLKNTSILFSTQIFRLAMLKIMNFSLQYGKKNKQQQHHVIPLILEYRAPF